MAKNAFSTLIWVILKLKLRERHPHLTEFDLADLQNLEVGEQWLDQMTLRLGGTSFEIAHLVEEAVQKGCSYFKTSAIRN